MSTRVHSRGFSPAVVVTVVLAIAVVGFGGWYMWHQSSESNAAKRASTEAPEASATTTPQSQNSPTDSPEENKDLIIKEWNIKVTLPEGMSGAVTYTMSSVISDPDGNQIQAAKIMLATSLLPGNKCGTTSTSVGEAAESGALYIRSESGKPFDAQRYKWTFREDILKTDEYNYHLNYVTPECIGSAVNKIDTLQTALVNLRQVE